MASENINSASGVDYAFIDPAVRLALRNASTTASILEANPMMVKELAWTRGESVYVQQWGTFAMGTLTECLGTKQLICDAYYQKTGKALYAGIGQDGVAMIANDMVTLGIIPTAFMMQLAAGSDDWFTDEKRMTALYEGWARACRMALGAWGGGETPVLKKTVVPGTFALSGTGTGCTKIDQLLGPKLIKSGDAIILCKSAGLHANGGTGARELAELLGPDGEGYLVPISDGRPYGEALLDPTPIYVQPIVACLMKLPGSVHYGVHVTGHGWRKLMRAPQPWEYRITEIPSVPAVLAFLQRQREMDNHTAYATYNMGAGFALYVEPDAADDVVGVLGAYGCPAFRAGTVHQSDARRVVIEPLDIVYESRTLDVR
jgi:phosphoribosylformylglycinamidine cyclo-ligase